MSTYYSSDELYSDNGKRSTKVIIWFFFPFPFVERLILFFSTILCFCFLPILWQDPIMAVEFIGGSILSAVIEVLGEKLTAPEILGFFKSHKLNDALLGKLKETQIIFNTISELTHQFNLKWYFILFYLKINVKIIWFRLFLKNKLEF